MAQWAKSKYQVSNYASIGCVIPNLDKIRDRVAQLFSDVFMTKDSQPPYNISAGKPLNDYPIIHTALQILNLQRPYVYTDFFSQLLITPFLGDAESERMERAKLDVLLRKYNVNRIALRDKLKADSSIYHLPQHIPKLSKRLLNYYSIIDSLDTHLLYSDWAEIFTQLLTTLGWKGERSINSEEYQTI
jgi:ATP-dependent helicase/nuclease subunit B